MNGSQDFFVSDRQRDKQTKGWTDNDHFYGPLVQKDILQNKSELSCALIY